MPRESQSCDDLDFDRTNIENIKESCPDFIRVPAETVAFGHVFFIYKNKSLEEFSAWPPPPNYVCYNDQLCDGFDPTTTFIVCNNATCRRPEDFPFTFNSYAITRGSWYDMYATPIFNQCTSVVK